MTTKTRHKHDPDEFLVRYMSNYQGKRTGQLNKDWTGCCVRCGETHPLADGLYFVGPTVPSHLLCDKCTAKIPDLRAFVLDETMALKKERGNDDRYPF